MKYTLAIFITTLLLLSYNFSLASDSDGETLKTAIIENRLDLVKSIIGTSDLSSRSELLDLAVKDATVCRREIVETLIQRGAVVSLELTSGCQKSLFGPKCTSSVGRSDNFIDAVENKYPETLSILIPRATPEKISDVSKYLEESVIPHIKNTRSFHAVCDDPNGKDMGTLTKIRNILQKENQRYCSESQKPKNCLWAEKLKDQILISKI